MATFGERLRELRNERGLRQAEVGAIVGVSYNTISKWETGEREPDTKNKKSEESFDPNEVYYTHAQFFDVPMLYLIGVSDDRTWHVLSDEEAADVAARWYRVPPWSTYTVVPGKGTVLLYKNVKNLK